jgi:hypothetical protein
VRLARRQDATQESGADGQTVLGRRPVQAPDVIFDSLKIIDGHVSVIDCSDSHYDIVDLILQSCNGLQLALAVSCVVLGARCGKSVSRIYNDRRRPAYTDTAHSGTSVSVQPAAEVEPGRHWLQRAKAANRPARASGPHESLSLYQ